MREFEFHEPETVQEAVSALANLGDDACVMAGGTALILAMRQRMLVPEAVVSLSRVDELRGIWETSDGGLRIGALTRHSDIARSDTVISHFPMLAQMAAELANPQVRNQGTLGGNLCYADPATDPPAALIAHDAQVDIAGPNGTRRLPMEDFAEDYFTTALEVDEIVTAICLPAPNPGETALYRRHLRTRAEHRPVANIAVAYELNNGTCKNVRLAIGAAVPVSRRLRRVEALLEGEQLSQGLIAEVADMVAADIDPISDGRGQGPFRRRIAATLARRLLAEAAGLDWSEHRT